MKQAINAIHQLTELLINNDSEQFHDLLELAVQKFIKLKEKRKEYDFCSDLDRIVQNSKHAPMRRLILSRALMRNEKYPEAVSFCKRALSDSPKLWHIGYAKTTISKLVFLLGEINELINLLDKKELFAVKVSPQHSSDLTHKRKLVIENKIPSIFYPKLPKSASVSITTCLSNILDIPGVSTTTGTFPDFHDYLIPSWIQEFLRRPALTGDHTFATPFNIAVLKASGIKKVIVNIRNPLQALLSLIHHWERYYFQENATHRDHIFPVFPPGYDNFSFEKKCDYNIEQKLRLIIDWIQSWAMVDQDHDNDMSILFTTYEEFTQDKKKFVERVFEFLNIGNGWQIEKDVLIEANEIKIHYRKGEVDEWRKVFSKKQRDFAWELIPDNLKKRFHWEK